MELQKPAVQSVINDMTLARELPNLPKETANLVIVTGFEALGRNHEVNRLMTFINALQQMPNAQATVKWTEVTRRLATGLNVEDTDSLIMSDEEMSAANQQAIAAEVLQRAAAPVAGAAAKAQFAQ